MACPVASTLSLGAACGGVYTLFVQDQRRRLVSLAILLALVAGWTVYFVWARTPEVRLALDAASTAAVLAGIWRLYRLVRYEGVVPPFTREMSRLLAWLRPAMRSPWVLSLKGALVLMLIADWLGLAEIAMWHYVIASALLVGVIGWRALRTRNAETQELGNAERQNRRPSDSGRVAKT